MEEANKAPRTEFKEPHEHGEERYRHDRDAVRQEAEETARFVVEDTAAESAGTMPLVLATVDVKLVTKLETFSGHVCH